MRISTSQMFNVSTSGMSSQQAEMARLQQQMAAGKRILTAADDPVAASAAMVEQQSITQIDQYQRNIDSASHRINLAESTLSQIGDVAQSARTLLVNAGDAVLSASDRASIATQLSEHLKTMLALANSQDGNGRFLFSGYQDATAPYSQTPTGATYVGDSGQPVLQVGSRRYIETSNAGAQIFEAAPTGNGTFATTISDPAASPAVTNGGTGLIDNGKVLNAAGYTGQTYIIKFNAGGSTYDVIQRTGGVETTLSSGNAYGSGNAIQLAGGAIETSISGAPVSGDRFVVAPSSTQNMFTTLQSAINALNSWTPGALPSTVYTDAMRLAQTNLDQATDTVLTVRTSIGARLSELDTLKSSNDGVKIQHTQRMSDLQDLDYAQAASDLTHDQLAMQAAQQSFVRISNLSLFNFLG
ncbi:MAG: flagellar hook-associated protein 3 [Burkholderiaceae bacterium]|nr:MAG: flagellar hook-associated protein 3 [Burkholderiaceae bacterium]